jgi:hypothetical protein
MSRNDPVNRTPHIFNHAFVEALVPLYVPIYQNDFIIRIAKRSSANATAGTSATTL